jgi:hypothetical protein
MQDRHVYPQSYTESGSRLGLLPRQDLFPHGWPTFFAETSYR